MEKYEKQHQEAEAERKEEKTVFAPVEEQEGEDEGIQHLAKSCSGAGSKGSEEDGCTDGAGERT